ncbi:MAG TPA: hypothetical protein VNC11_07935 [Gemmatimonadaceae bacterium]|nr:hypothetical protein [Gemmatimonadaceae bacterium]
MTIFFWKRRGLDSFAEAIRPELHGIATPEPSPQLLDRILASRAAGARVILPEATAARPVFARYVSVAAVIAAAVLVMIYGVASSRSDDIVSVSGLFGREAYAQTVLNVDRPALPLAVFVPGKAIRPMTLEFTRRVRNPANVVTSEASNMLVITAATVEGIPAWEVATPAHNVVAARQSNVEAETVFVARTNLKMLRRSVHVSPYSRYQRINIQQSFHNDSVTGRMNTDGPSIGAGRTFARRLRPEFGPYISDVIGPIALMGSPLSPTWKRSASLLGWAVIPKDIFYPIVLRVEGEDRVKVPAGTFDCWRISIRLREKQIMYWARKSDGLGVRVLDESNPTTNGTRETVLRRIVQ